MSSDCNKDMGSNDGMSFWEVLHELENDAPLKDVKRSIFKHRMLKILRKGTVEERNAILKNICKEQIYLCQELMKAWHVAMQVHGSNEAYRIFFQYCIESQEPVLSELANTLRALGGGTPEEVLRSYRPNPRAQLLSSTYSWMFVSQPPACSALILNVILRTWGVVCMHIIEALRSDLEALELTEEDLGFFSMHDLVGSGDQKMDYTWMMKGLKKVFKEGLENGDFNYKELVKNLHVVQYAQLENIEGCCIPET